MKLIKSWTVCLQSGISNYIQEVTGFILELILSTKQLNYETYDVVIFEKVVGIP
jgi:hypothetical protein